jgi:hypothetical protein
VSIHDKIVSSDMPIPWIISVAQFTWLPFGFAAHIISIYIEYSPPNALILKREAIRIRDPIVDVRGEAEIAVQIKGTVLQMRYHGLGNGVVGRRQNDLPTLATLRKGGKDGRHVVDASTRCMDCTGFRVCSTKTDEWEKEDEIHYDEYFLVPTRSYIPALKSWDRCTCIWKTHLAI